MQQYTNACANCCQSPLHNLPLVMTQPLVLVLVLVLGLLAKASSLQGCVVDQLCKQKIGFISASGAVLLNLSPHDTVMLTNGSTVVCMGSKKQPAQASFCETITHLPSGHLDIITNSLERKTQKYYILTQQPHEPSNYIDILNPPYGSIAHNRLEVHVHTRAAQAYDALQFTAAGLTTLTLTPDTQMIESKVNDIDPSSFFYEIHTVAYGNQGTTVTGPKSIGYIEFVLPDEDILKHRRYANRTTTTTATAISTPIGHQVQSVVTTATADISASGSTHTRPHSSKDASSHTQHPPINVCIFGADIMDGQRRIWLLQSEHMNKSLFQFTWILSTDSSTSYNNSARHVLIKLNISIIDSPTFPIDSTELLVVPGDERPPAAHVWNNNVENLFKYAHESLVHYNYVIDDVQPLWCRRIYQKMRRTLLQKPCEILVYGNTRLQENDYSGDVLITDTAKALGIPTVAELMNLYISKDIVPTAIVAPSTYAVEHESIQAVLHTTGRSDITIRHGTSVRSTAPVAVVIPPSVDTDKFEPATYPDNASAAYRHPACTVTGDVLSKEHTHFPCFVVGFLARLSPEKNPGLFLQAAYEILQLHPFVRITVVGDGALRAPLEDLAARLQISWAVHFAGWVSNEHLPQLLAGMDVVINPSLRAWSETFCISNIEVMSMEVPLVTFAVGGIGEYVQDPLASAGVNGSLPDYSVSNNAVVVNRATPLAIAGTVHHLILHPALRRSIGRAGRETVLSYFTIDRQMQDYEALYMSLHSKI